MDRLTELIMQVCNCTLCYENKPCEKVLQVTEKVRKIKVATQHGVQADLLPCGHSKDNQRWSLPEGVEYCAACAATNRYRKPLAGTKGNIMRTAIQPAPIEEFVRDLKNYIESDDD